MAMSNIRERLALHFDAEASMTAGPRRPLSGAIDPALSPVVRHQDHCLTQHDLIPP